MKQIITLILFATLGFNAQAQHILGTSVRGWKGEAIYGLDYAYRWKSNRLGISLFYLENQYDYSNDIRSGKYLGSPYHILFDQDTEEYTSRFIGQGASLNYVVDIRSFGHTEQFLIGWIISGSYLQIEDEYYYNYQQSWPHPSNYSEYEGEFKYSALSCMTGVNLSYRVTKHISVDGRVGVNYYYPLYNRDAPLDEHHIYTSDAQYSASEFEVGLGVSIALGEKRGS